MVQVGGNAYFPEETVRTERGRQIGEQDLDRHLSLMLWVIGQVDGSHAATTKLPLDVVAALQRGFDFF